MLPPSPPDLLALYARELEAGNFSADRGPERRDRGAGARASAAARSSAGPGLLQRLRDRWRAAARPAARGLYLWGPVGRGKTWLMDLFYDSLPLRAKRRSHFHHLMRDVHALLGQLRGRPDPIVHVARTRRRRRTRTVPR